MTIGSATSFAAGFVILTAGLAITGATLMIFILTNGRPVLAAQLRRIADVLNPQEPQP